MNESAAVWSAVIPVAALALVGLAIRRLNWLTEEADQSLLRVSVNVLLPCLFFDAILGNRALLETRNLVLAPLVGAATVAAGMAAAWYCARGAGLDQPSEKHTFAVTVGLYNYGYIPLPLSQVLFDQATTGVLILHNAGVEATLWTLGVAVMRGRAGGFDWRKFISPPLVAMLLAVALNLAGAESYVPAALRRGVQWLGQCAIPMSLILIGAIVADHLGEFHTAKAWRVIGVGLILRLGILPVLFLLLARYLPASLELKRVIVLQSAMPAAVFPIIMARHYGGDPPTALRVIITTSAAAFLTLPFWLHFGLAWIARTAPQAPGAF